MARWRARSRTLPTPGRASTSSGWASRRRSRSRSSRSARRSILSQNESPDIPFRWSLNPYRGCQHACSYCYARPTHQYLGFGAGTDFDSKIVVKTNAAELLRKKLAARSWRGEEVTFSGVTDCYQPIEASYGITRACLEVCREFRNPVAIITKGALVRRDIGLLQEIDRRARALWSSSAFRSPTTETGRAMEPFGSSPRSSLRDAPPCSPRPGWRRGSPSRP